MCSDMMSTGIYGAEMANIKLGDTVVVFGIGPVGLMSVCGARLLGAGKIIAIGTRSNCVELAKEYGATHIVSYKDGDVVEQIEKIAGGKVDSCIIAGGDCTTMNQALSVHLLLKMQLLITLKNLTYFIPLFLVVVFL